MQQGLKYKLAINLTGFLNMYIDALEEICKKHNVTICKFDHNYVKQHWDTLNKEYDYIYADCCTDYATASVFHYHTILQRVKSAPFFLYALIFYLGHYRKIELSRKKYNELKKIIVVGSGLKNDFVSNYDIPTNKVIVSNVGFVTPNNKINYKPKKLNENEEFVISMSGCGFLTKGGYRLLFALKQFKKLYPKIKIKAIIIYDNYKKNQIVRLCVRLLGLSENICFVNRQSDMFAFYQQSHCFICPSVMEAFGRVVPEAMYAKVPVIVGSNVGAADIIQDGINGFVFNASKNASKNLAKKIKEVYDRYNSLDELIENAYQTSLSTTWENFAINIFYGLYPEFKPVNEENINVY